MCQVALSEGHEKADALDSRNVQGKALDLLMVKQVHILLSHTVEIVDALDLHGLCLYPVAVLPVGAFGGNLADIDLRVKIRCKRIAMVAAVAVQYVNVVDLVKLML